MRDKRSALDALSAAEKAAVLDELLAARPDLRELAEACAAQVMTGADRAAVAGDVEDALQGLVYRFRTHRRCCSLRFGRMNWLRQDRGLCPFACST